MSSPSKPSRPHPHILDLLHLHASRTASQTTRTIQHLHALLSRTSTLDTALLTTTYTLHLLHALLTRHPTTSRSRFTTTLSPLTSLLDEFRILLRLWGLLGIYTWGAKTYLHPPGDAVVRGITWAQVCACAIYQIAENAAFFAGKGVLGWERTAVARAWLWSARAWMVHVALELVRLGYRWRELSREDLRRKERMERQRKRERALVGEEKGSWAEEREDSGEVVGQELELREEKVREERMEVELIGVEMRREGEVAEGKWREWSRELGVGAAYMPMTIHYSLENGPFGEGSLGALGVVVGWLTFGRAWRESA